MRQTPPPARPGAAGTRTGNRPTRVVAPSPRRRLGWWTQIAVGVGLLAGRCSRRLGLGAGAIIAGRVTLALAPAALRRLAQGRQVVLVSGTNGKTTTSHLLAAALGTASPVAHNASGANMADGALAALMAEPDAPVAVLEVDELHVAAVAASVHPAAVVVLNLSRDQLDRGSEVRAVGAALTRALAAHPDTVVIANADDPVVVWATARSRVVWVSAGSRWGGDASSCPRCGQAVRRATDPESAGGGGLAACWRCRCGLVQPTPHWAATESAAVTDDAEVPLALQLPGQFNRGNAVMAMATAALLGIDPQRAAAAMSGLSQVAGRYDLVTYRGRELRLLLAKNPAGWAETVALLDRARPLLVVVNAREADGRDTSWLWDVAFPDLAGRPVVAAGERAADVGVRLTYAGIEHHTVADPLAGLETLPAGVIDVVANYTAFHVLLARLNADATERAR